MKREERDEWCAALRSGEFTQGYSSLDTNGKQCCLGVKALLDIRAGRHGIIRQNESGTTIFRYGTEGGYMSATMPTNVMLLAWGLSIEQANHLSRLNDKISWELGGGAVSVHPFPDIATWIEENVPVEDEVPGA